MITPGEIDREIATLESQTPTYQIIGTLAALYTVRDHIRDSSPVRVETTTPFLTACNGEPACEVLAVMDELMSTLEVIMPRLYAGVMRRLSKPVQ